jgi:hypothetical protein
LLDRVQEFFLGNLKLGIGPSRDLNDHVQDSLLLICIQGNVMER